MKSSHKYLLLGGGVLALIVAVGTTVLVMNSQTKQKAADEKPAASKTTTSDSQTSSKYSGAVLYKVGDSVPFQSQTLKVNSVNTSNSISGAFGSPVFADSGTKFVTVNITVTNTTTDPFTYSPYVLIDQKDRLYNAYSKTIGNVDNYLETAELSPSVPKTGNEVYQVPQDSTTLRLGGQVGDTGVLHFVEFDVQ